MKFAESIREIPNAFNPRPLTRKDELRDFYYPHTMPVRTGDAKESPIQDIMRVCWYPSDTDNVFLLLGHRGCGKSTELNKMSEELEQEGYPVRTVRCAMDLDLMNPAFTDLLVLMGEALLDIAQHLDGCRVDPKTEKTIRDFWTEVEKSRIVTTDASAEAGAGVSIASALHALFFDARADLKFNEETRKVYREQIQLRLGVWRDAMDALADSIAAVTKGKRPVIVFEDLDRLDEKEAWKVFYSNAGKLAGFGFPVVYTFPIALSYDARFNVLSNTFNVALFPMIKLTQMDNTPYREGLDTIRRIVEKRTRLELFDAGALDLMIEKTGGSLRDLFAAISAAATRARGYESAVIRVEDAERALIKQRSMLTRRFERKHYEFLREIMDGNRDNIEDKEMLLEMLLAGVVLEYNGERWHNVHPLVAEFLSEPGRV